VKLFRSPEGRKHIGWQAKPFSSNGEKLLKHMGPIVRVWLNNGVRSCGQFSTYFTANTAGQLWLGCGKLDPYADAALTESKNRFAIEGEMSDLKHYRYQADQAKRLAGQVSDPELRVRLLEMADEYSRYAALIEARTSPTPA
jgi:hypothetical protein